MRTRIGRDAVKIKGAIAQELAVAPHCNCDVIASAFPTPRSPVLKAADAERSIFIF